VWDDELALVAQRWADQCLRGHDKSRNVGKIPRIGCIHFLRTKVKKIAKLSDRFRAGQNVAVTWSRNQEPPSKDKPEFPRLIRAWFDEYREFDRRHVEPFVFTKKLGHYTQESWNKERNGFRNFQVICPLVSDGVVRHLRGGMWVYLLQRGGKRLHQDVRLQLWTWVRDQTFPILQLYKLSFIV
jgi:hypothetical protein